MMCISNSICIKRRRRQNNYFRRQNPNAGLRALLTSAKVEKFGRQEKERKIRLGFQSLPSVGARVAGELKFSVSGDLDLFLSNLKIELR